MEIITKEVYALVSCSHGHINVLEAKTTLKDIFKVVSQYFEDCNCHSDYIASGKIFVAILDNANCKFMLPGKKYNCAVNIGREEFIEKYLIKKFSNEEVINILKSKDFSSYCGTKWFKILMTVMEKNYEKFFKLTKASCIIIQKDDKIELTDDILEYLKNHIKVISFSKPINYDFIKALATNDSFVDHIKEQIKSCESQDFNRDLLKIMLYSDRANELAEFMKSEKVFPLGIRRLDGESKTIGMDKYILSVLAFNKNADKDIIEEYKKYYSEDSESAYFAFNEITAYGNIDMKAINNDIYTFLLENFSIRDDCYYMRDCIIESIDPTNQTHIKLFHNLLINHKEDKIAFRNIIHSILNFNQELIKEIEVIFDKIKNDTVVKTLFDFNLLVDKIMQYNRGANIHNLIREYLEENININPFISAKANQNLCKTLYESYLDDCFFAYHKWNKTEAQIIQDYINGNRYYLHPLVVFIVKNTRKYDAKLIKLRDANINSIISKVSTDRGIIKQLISDTSCHFDRWFYKGFDLGFLISDKSNRYDKYILYNNSSTKTVKKLVDKYINSDMTEKRIACMMFMIYRNCANNNDISGMKYMHKKIKANINLNDDFFNTILRLIENYIKLSEEPCDCNFINITFKAIEQNDIDKEFIVMVKKDMYNIDDFHTLIDSFNSFVDSHDNISPEETIDTVMNASGYNWRYADKLIMEFQEPDYIII